MQTSKRKRDQRSSPLSVSSSSSDGSPSGHIDKSALLAKLDEMSKAIDGYKELKTKGTASKVSSVQQNQSRILEDLHQKSQQSELSEIQQNQSIVVKVNQELGIGRSFSVETLDKLDKKQSVGSLTTESVTQRKEQENDMVLIASANQSQSNDEHFNQITQIENQTMIKQNWNPQYEVQEKEIIKQTQQVKEQKQMQATTNTMATHRDFRCITTHEDPVSFNQTITLQAFNTMTSNGGELAKYLDPNQNSPKFLESMSSKAFFMDMLNTKHNPLQYIEQQTQEVQCDLDYQMQTEFIEKHKFQLQAFEESLVILKEQLVLQQENEYDLRQQMDTMQSEIVRLRNEKEESLMKEEELLKQVDQLVGVVEDQTQELRTRDRQIRELQDFQQKFYELQQDVDQLITQQDKQVSDKDKAEKEKQDALKQIADLQEKLSNEFSKKRKMKQEYDEQLIELHDEADYFKDKYQELKDLLSNCTEQLRQFEELNCLRNDVIEKLEKENSQFRTILQQQIAVYGQVPQYNGLQLDGNAMGTEDSNVYQQTTPGKSEKSFSLNLQQVNCERSRQISRDLSQISERAESQYTSSQTERQHREPYTQYTQENHYLTERKDLYTKKDLDVIPTTDHSDDLQYLKTQQQAPKQVAYYTECTPKNNQQFQTIKPCDLSNTCTKTQDRLKDYLIEDNEDCITQADQMSVYRGSQAMLNHSISEQRLPEPQIEESVSGLDPTASISRYERVLQGKRQQRNVQNRNSIHYTQNNFFSPAHPREDPYKLSFGDIQHVMTPSILSAGGNVSSIQALNQQEYCQSESKYQYGRYQRENKIFQQVVNKENSYFADPRYSQQTHIAQHPQYEHQDHNVSQQEIIASYEGNSVLSGLRQGRPIRLRDQNDHQALLVNSAQQLDMVLAQKQGNKKPFEYMATNPIFHSHPLQESQQSDTNRGRPGYQTQCTFAKGDSVESDHNRSYASQDDSQVYSESTPRESLNKSSSIRDEIKKLHKNINSLRQKMNIKPSNGAAKYASVSAQRTANVSTNPSVKGSPKSGAQPHFHLMKERAIE